MNGAAQQGLWHLKSAQGSKLHLCCYYLGFPVATLRRGKTMFPDFEFPDYYLLSKWALFISPHFDMNCSLQLTINRIRPSKRINKYKCAPETPTWHPQTQHWKKERISICYKWSCPVSKHRHGIYKYTVIIGCHYQNSLSLFWLYKPHDFWSLNFSLSSKRLMVKA